MTEELAVCCGTAQMHASLLCLCAAHVNGTRLCQETLHVKISDECCFSKLSQPRKKRRRAWLTVHLAVWRSKVAFDICEVLRHCKQPREDRGRDEERWKHDACSRHQYDIRDGAQSNICVTHTHTHTEALFCPVLPSVCVCVCEAASLLSSQAVKLYLTSPQMFCCQLSHIFTAEQRQAQQPEGIRFILGQ